MLVAVPAFTPESYQTSSLHGEGQIWAENNCYVDLCIDLVHAHGLCPQAMLGYAVAVDFEGDQWTFHKPQHNDLWDLYQLDIQELTCWRPLRELVREHLAAGKLICVEAEQPLQKLHGFVRRALDTVEQLARSFRACLLQVGTEHVHHQREVPQRRFEVVGSGIDEFAQCMAQQSFARRLRLEHLAERHTAQASGQPPTGLQVRIGLDDSIGRRIGSQEHAQFSFP